MVGQCELSCQTGLKNCSGKCVDNQTDNSNCGACGTTCGAGQHCSAGVCKANCQTGLTDCNGKCVNLNTDFYNCGSCSNMCAAGEVCKTTGTTTACTVSCQTGLTNCSGKCVDLLTDINNCKACGTKCSSGEVCSAGACSLSCQAGLTNCSSKCVNTKTDNSNCGGCGTSCAANQACLNGTCTVLCGSGQTNCSGTCYDLQSNVSNCGTCGTACPAVTNGTAACSAGQCVIDVCISTRGDCDKLYSTGCEVYLINNNANCGQCGNDCGSGNYNNCTTPVPRCSSGVAYTDRNCTKLGCSGKGCFSTLWVDTQLVQTCPTGTKTEYRCTLSDRESRLCTDGCYNGVCGNSCAGHSNGFLFVEDCGSGDYNNCGSFGADYCDSGNTVYRSRTCYRQGCLTGTCFNNAWTDAQLVKTCATTELCSSGVCGPIPPPAP